MNQGISFKFDTQINHRHIDNVVRINNNKTANIKEKKLYLEPSKVRNTKVGVAEVI